MCELLAINWLSTKYLFLALVVLECRLDWCDMSPGSQEMIRAGGGIFAILRALGITTQNGGVQTPPKYETSISASIQSHPPLLWTRGWIMLYTKGNFVVHFPSIA